MHFTIEELFASATAKAKGIDNKPNVQQIICLVYLAAYVLEPLREAMKEPIKISSGFRCERLNRAVGGVSNSQHTKGQAADICIDGDLTKGRRWFDYIKTHLQFDHLGARPQRHLLDPRLVCRSTIRAQPKTSHRQSAEKISKPPTAFRGFIV